MGLANWRAGLFPCFCCHATSTSPSAWIVCLGVSHHLRSFEEACSACEHVVVMTRAQHAEIVAILECSKTSAGPRGRSLKQDYDPLVCGTQTALSRVTEPGMLRVLSELQISQRACSGGDVVRRPACATETHCSPEHTVYLGCLDTLVAIVFWRCVRHKVFAVECTNEEVLQNTCLSKCIEKCIREKKRMKRQRHPKNP